jgi:hypothetical protein
MLQIVDWNNKMETSSSENYRKEPMRERVQLQNPVTGKWVKVDTKSGKIIDVKKTAGPFKGVTRREK